MFDVGFTEIMLIFVILLIVVGPERLPKLARTIGLWVGKARTIVSSVKSEVERELRVDELKQSIQNQSDSSEFEKLAEQVKSINTDMQSMTKDFKTSMDSASSSFKEDSTRNAVSHQQSPQAKPSPNPASTETKPPSTPSTSD